jgi:hypothetical protein
MTSDHQERARVRSRIGSLIMEFCVRRKKYADIGGPLFFMEELRRFVEQALEGPIAPDSPGRILRQLRQQRHLNYIVVSRSRSLYRLKPLKQKPAEQAELFEARAS